MIIFSTELCFRLTVMEFGYKKETILGFDEALKKLRAALAKEGFGIITEIDAKETFRKKLDVDFSSYVILGACHPDSAYKLLNTNREFGLLLPCNVAVYEESGHVFVSTILPTSMLKAAEGSSLSILARDIENRLRNVINQF